MKNIANMLKNWQNRKKKTPIQRRGKTFIAIAIVSLILLLGVFIFSAKNIATYDAEEKTMIIRESLLSNKILAEISLKSELNVYVIRGKDRLVAEFEVDSLEKNYNTLFEKMEFYDLKNNMKKFERQFTYRYKQFYEEEVNDYETVCKERIVNISDVEKYDCTENLIGSHAEEKFNWVDLNDKKRLPEGKLTIGIFTDVKAGDNVEWIPTILGTRIPQWAEWTESLNVNLLSYRTMNETSGTVVHDSLGVYNSTIAGDGWGGAGLIGTAYTMDANDKMADNALLLGQSDVSYNLWVLRTSLVVTAPWDGVLATGVATAGAFYFYYEDANTAYTLITPAGTFPLVHYETEHLNEWYMFTITTNNTHVTLYANGTLIESQSNPGWSTGYGGTTNNASWFANYDGAQQMTNSRADEIGVWNRTLTPTEITQLYNEGNGITYAPPDTIPPSVIINSPENITYNTNFNATATATDTNGISDCWVTVDDGVTNFTLINSTSNDIYNYTAPSVYSDGGYLAEFFCNDSAGNVNDTESISFTLDFTNPQINITYPINLSSHSINTVDVNYTYSDANIDSCWYSNGTYEFNTSLTSCGTNITDVIWVDGKHNVTVWANDSAGNENSSSVTFTVNAGPPITTLITPIDNLNSSTQIDDFQFNMTFAISDWTNFTFYVWDNDGAEHRKRVVINGTPDDDCSVSDTDTDYVLIDCIGQDITTNDNYEWNIYACKENGMCGFAPANFSFLVDTIAPVGVLDSPANNTNTSTASQNFTINITDNLGIINATLYIYNSSGDLYNQSTMEYEDGVVDTVLGFLVTLVDDVYTWFYEIFDFAGNEDITENRTLTVDTINPQINITYPINNSNYTSRNLNIKYIAEDTNLNNCWWSNDSMSINHSLATCGTNVTTQFWNAGNHNVTIWINDTAGNQNSSDVTFHIKNIFENSQTYSASVLEQSSQTFSINITYDSSTFSNAVLVLHYNNTEYYGIEVGNYGDEVIYNATLNTPSLNVRTNFTFYWAITLVNSETVVVNSTFHNQTVNNMLLGDCDAQSVGLYNFTIVDEKTQVLLNPATWNTNALVDFQLYTSGRVNLVANYSQNFTEINPFSICLNNTLTGAESYILDGTIRYGADNYSTEYYHFQSAIIDSTTLAQNITLFDLDNSTSTSFEITYKDSYFIPVSNALIQIQRKYLSEGVFKTVEIPKTDSIGQTIAHLEEENVVYTFIVLKDGKIVATFTDFLVKCDDPVLGTCEININAFKSHLEPETFINTEDFSFTLEFNETTKTIKIIYTIPSGSSSTILLNTTLYDGLGTTQVCSDSLTSASGTLSCVIPNSFGNTTVVNTIYKDGEQIVRGFSSVQESPSDLYGANLMFLGFFLIITMIGVGLGSSPMISGVFLIIGAILSIAFNLVANTGFFGYGATILWLIIAVVIVLMKGARRE